MPRIGYVINGKYYKGKSDLSELIVPQNSTHKEWDHDKQRSEHGADIVQPRKNGQPNEEFIALYPEAAADYGFVDPPESPSEPRYGN